jgi:hypothetical protein
MAAQQSTEQVAAEKEIAARGPRSLQRGVGHSRTLLVVVNVLLLALLGVVFAVLRIRKRNKGTRQNPPVGRSG